MCDDCSQAPLEVLRRQTESSRSIRGWAKIGTTVTEPRKRENRYSYACSFAILPVPSSPKRKSLGLSAAPVQQRLSYRPNPGLIQSATTDVLDHIEASKYRFAKALENQWYGKWAGFGTLINKDGHVAGSKHIGNIGEAAWS